MTRTSLSSTNVRAGRAIARRWVLAPLLVIIAASCSRLPTTEVAADGPTTTYVTTPPTSAPITSAPSTSEADPAVTTTAAPTTAAPTTAAPTTAAPTTAAPTTAAPTTAAPTTAAPTTVPPTTDAPTTTTTTSSSTSTPVEDEELEELPYTGPREAVLFALIGLTMVVAGRSVLDLSNLVARFGRSGGRLPPR